MPLSCPLWGDGSKWGDGDLWCRISGSVKYFADILDLAAVTSTSWNLASPDVTIWTPSISTAGIITFTSGGTGPVTAVPVLPGVSAVWTPSISNGGILTLTSGSYTGQVLAGFLDASNVGWLWMVGSDSISFVSTRATQGQRVKLNRMSVRLDYSPGANFVIDSIRPLVNIPSQLPARYVVNTEFATHQRVSILVNFSGGVNFVIDRIHVLANVKHQDPRA